MKAHVDYSDERNKSWCIHCGSWLSDSESNQDHTPSKSLLRKPYPENLPTVCVCKICNGSFAESEQYTKAALIAATLGRTTPIESDPPELENFFIKNRDLFSKLEKCKTTEGHGNDTININWHFDLDIIRKAIVKNARGHIYYELGEPVFGDPQHVNFMPISTLNRSQIDEFLQDRSSGYPEVGSRALERIFSRSDTENGFIVVQPYLYLYRVEYGGFYAVKMLIWDYLVAEVIWDD